MSRYAPHYVLHGPCRGCGVRSLAVIDGLLPACLVCDAQRRRIVGTWALRRPSWSLTLSRGHS
jgi:hypothetical protein